MNSRNPRERIIAILLALLVTFLWSTSFIIIKWGLAELPPLTFASLRYSLAFLFFIPFILRKRYLSEIKGLTGRDWTQLLLLGLVFYTLTQGAQFLGLSLLPSVTVSLILNFTPLVVALMGIFMLNEIPTKLQWSGSFLFIAGILIYFLPLVSEENRVLGIIVMGFGVLANSGAAVIGRGINRKGKLSPLTITFISMGFGSLLLILVSLFAESFSSISTNNILFLLWLAGINTALAFTLWNKTLRILSAMESSIINGTMLIQIAVLAWIFLDEPITIKELIGMLFAAVGAVLVQLRRRKKIE